MTIDQFTKSSAPVTVIVNVANPVAIKLIKILLEQGSRLLIVDKLTAAKRRLLGDLLGRSDCLFMEAESTFKNIEKFKKIDYIYYFLSQISAGSTYPELFPENMEIDRLDHKEFIRETNRIDAYMKLAVSFEASFTMITSAYVSQFLEVLPESNLQIQKYAESLVMEYVERSNANARVIRLGELIGRDSDIASPTYVARLVREVILRKKINIFGDGMQQNFLIHAEDAVYAVLKAAFTSKAKGKIYLVAYPHPFTSLSIAYQLLELTVEEKEVIFNEVLQDHEKVSKTRDMCLAPSIAALGWEPQIKIEQALAETTAMTAQYLNQKWEQVGLDGVLLSTEQKPLNKQGTGRLSAIFESIVSVLYNQLVVQPIRSLVSFTKPSRKKSTPAEKETKTRNVIAVLVALVVVALVTPYVHFAVTAYKFYSVAKQLKYDVATLESSRLETYSNLLTTYSDGLVRDYRAVSYLQYVPKVGEWYQASRDLVYGGSSLLSSATVSLKVSAPAIKIAKGFASVSPNNPAGTVSRDYYNEIGDIMKNESMLTQAIQDAKIGDGRIQRVEVGKFPYFLESRLLQLKEISKSYTQSLEEVSKTYDVIPYLLGYKERRNYFLMIQNETELRATGGWFTNYALLGIENGQVRQLVVNDVYDLDGKITGVEAPKDMQHALSVKTIKTALSNWNPEMKETADQITTLLNQSGVVKPNDVTISITFEVVKDILSAIGPIQVEGLGEVTASTLYEKVGILHSQFVPGVQNKNKAVSDFMPKFLNAIATAPIEKKQEVLKVLGNAITQRSIMIYSDNIELRTKLLDTYATYRVIKEEDNPLFVVDWNWGGNKANRYLKRSTDIVINETTKLAVVTMTYTNESKTDSYPEGQYVNAQRIYYPKEFVFTKLSNYATKPTTYTTEAGVPYVLAELRVKKLETKAFSAEFAIKEMPEQLSLYKQSGYDVEAVRVIITRGAESKISEAVLKEQGFSQVDTRWVKTYVRKSDVMVKLR
ncbi:DUF4012 domain-containing protein [bacterium]|nr:DUF4012 domain-containing protein [bacterium]